MTAADCLVVYVDSADDS